MLRFSALILLLSALALAGCGGGGGQTGGGGSATGDAAKGKTVFETTGCIACHALRAATGATGTTGPDLNGVGTRAGTRKPGTAAADYLRESEKTPNAFVLEGFPRDTMPAWTGTDAQLNDLIAFLLDQK